ncbi:MAG: 4Fe-4S binding protein [Spirochaetales bacterium]|nr:4Fe-4S binding protein [Spirochaetales bacterium]
MLLKGSKDVERLKGELESRYSRFDKEIVITTNATCCKLKKSKEVEEAFSRELKKIASTKKINMRLTGCLGFCEIEPIVIINPQGILYREVKPEDVAEIISESVLKDDVVTRLVYTSPSGSAYANKADIPFYKKQLRIVTGNNDIINPTSIEDYIAAGGYSALARVLETMKPDEVTEEIKKSGLRGRGGGGFPTGKKWETCLKAKEEDGVCYVICNADEGDPGAYMDRSLLESNPHSVIEGMIIGSYAIGSNEGYIYVRAEYPLAVEHVRHALQQAEACGCLGDNIMGSGHRFRIRVSRGAGAFVCGESTALMASLEGKVGRPRAKYVHTVERGLWNKPTTLNNVETWSNVPLIINRGAGWFAGIGTKGSKGTKIFSLVGKINNTGLVEVPMGMTLREIIYDIGGGIPQDKKFKAVQTGGPSGGCIPENLLHLPVDFDELSGAGSMMGSGGMIVMDEDTCMVDVARYFINFLKDESCGKCVACREGIKQMLHILERICGGQGKEGDIELLEELGAYCVDTSLCALGATAGNPVITTIKYFRDEYEKHIKEKQCPAGVCKALFQYSISTDDCNGCGACRAKCPVEAITGGKKEAHSIDLSQCIKCGVCFDVCRFDAVKKVPLKGAVL